MQINTNSIKDTVHGDTLQRIYHSVTNNQPTQIIRPQSVYNPPRSRNLSILND